ncbi:MAG: GIY-YIG nuclease family protein [Proteobacteria bacterium]|nr:GIY-YIG nuclease family protein [Pseudomonadota bacterium]
MFVYCIRNKIDSKRYIGITIDLNNRLNKHARSAKNPSKNSKFHLAINKYGISNFELEWVKDYTDQVNDWKELGEIEEYYIKEYKTYAGFDDCLGYNMTLGKDGTLGYKHTDEAKKKISKPGELNPNFGKKLSKEQSLKLSESRKGRKRSEKAKKNTSLTMSKLSVIIDSVFYETISEASKTLGIPRSIIYNRALIYKKENYEAIYR